MRRSLKRKTKVLIDSITVTEANTAAKQKYDLNVFKTNTSTLTFDFISQQQKVDSQKKIKQMHNIDMQNQKVHTRRQFKADSSILKPSIISQMDHQVDYLMTSPSETLNIQNYPAVRKKRAKLQQPTVMRQESAQKSNQQLGKAQINQEAGKIDSEELGELKFTINFTTNFSFSQGQEEGNSSDKPKNNQNVVIGQDQFNSASQLKINYLQQKIHFQQQNEQKQSDLINPQILDSNQKSKTSLIESNIQMDEKSLYFQQLLLSGDRDDNISKLVNMPILPGTRIIFQVHLQSNLIHKTYNFWLDQGKQMTLLMKATKYNKLAQTTFEIVTYLPIKQVFCTCCTMDTNLQRNQFNLYKKTLDSRKNLLATICDVPNLSGQKCLTMYYPEIKQNSCVGQQIYQSLLLKNLKEYYRQRKQSSVDYLMTATIEYRDRLQMMSTYDFRTSKKSMEFKNSGGQLQVVIGKLGSKRYRVIGGAGVAPTQIFALAIAQIET